MKKGILFLIFYSSLNCYGQFTWEGDYMIKYDRELKISRESKVRIWTSNDSLHKMSWSFNAFQRNKWMWESSGYGVVNDSNKLELFVRSYKDFRPEYESKIFKKFRQGKPLYVITRSDDVVYIESKQGSKKRRFRLIKI